MNKQVGPHKTQVLVLNFTASRTVRNKLLLFISHTTHGNLIQQPIETKSVFKENITFEKGSYLIIMIGGHI